MDLRLGVVLPPTCLGLTQCGRKSLLQLLGCSTVFYLNFSNHEQGAGCKVWCGGPHTFPKRLFDR